MAVHTELNANQRAFLAAYRITASVSRSAAIADINKTTHYAWMREIPEYAAAFAETKLEAAEVLEDEAVRRAYEGTDEPQWYKGEICGHVKKYSDLLLIFLLKGAIPDKYKDRQSVELGRGPTLAELLTNEEKQKALNPGPTDEDTLHQE